MIGVAVKAINADSFFNSEKVMKALDEGQRKVLSKFGAFVRRRAQSSIKKAKVLNKKDVREAKKAGRTATIKYEPSAPGEPPRSRKGELKKFILFGYDVAEKNVVIGPTLVGGRPSDTPARLEYGGTFKHRRTGKLVKVSKRPFMRPAFEKEMAERMPAMFADSMQPI